jgi:hypothetical protein
MPEVVSSRRLTIVAFLLSSTFEMCLSVNKSGQLMIDAIKQAPFQPVGDGSQIVGDAGRVVGIRPG